MTLRIEVYEKVGAIAKALLDWYFLNITAYGYTRRSSHPDKVAELLYTMETSTREWCKLVLKRWSISNNWGGTGWLMKESLANELLTMDEDQHSQEIKMTDIYRKYLHSVGFVLEDENSMREDRFRTEVAIPLIRETQDARTRWKEIPHILVNFKTRAQFFAANGRLKMLDRWIVGQAENTLGQ